MSVPVTESFSLLSRATPYVLPPSSLPFPLVFSLPSSCCQLHFTVFCSSPESPLWPKENLDPVVVQEGAPLTLQCNPPPGLPSPVIFWMSSCKCGSLASEQPAPEGAVGGLVMG